jgi:hypothetical protein
MRCIVCGRSFESAFPPELKDSTPYGGTVFTSWGNFGSTVFDPSGLRESERLQIIVCDGCLTTAAKGGNVTHETVVKYEETAWDASPWTPPEEQ